MDDINLTSPSAWFSGLLSRHHLKVPDGRSLFQYRLTDEEFNSLKDVLEVSSHVFLRSIRIHGFVDALLVIYAAEWWRRNYSGGPWKWDKLLEDIGYDRLNLTQQVRGELVQTGLEKWNREVKVLNGHRRFLGSIAIEGGIPLSQLSENGSWIERILRPVLDRNLRRNIPINDLINESEGIIPKTFRSEAFKQVLKTIVEAVTELKERYPLADYENPTGYLDNQKPDWREAFPIPIDSHQGNLLLNKLVKSASESLRKNQLNSSLFVLERSISLNHSFEPVFNATLSLPETIQEKVLVEECKIPEGTSAFELLLSSSGVVTNLGRAVKTYYKGHSVYKIFGKSFVCHDERFLDEFELYVKLPDQSKYLVKLDDAASIDSNSPWMFAVDNQNLKLLSHGGSFSTKAENAVVYIPNTGNYSFSESGSFKQEAEVLEGKLFWFDGVLNYRNDEGSYVFKTGQEESEYNYELVGDKCRYAKLPSSIYIGPPKIYRRERDTGLLQGLPDMKLKVKPVGEPGNTWISAQFAKAGYYHFRLLDKDDHVLMNKKAGVLNKSFYVSLEADLAEVCKGKIVLAHLGESEISIDNAELSFSIEQDSSKHELSVSCLKQPPFSVGITVYPAGRKKPLAFEVPFPSRGALLFRNNELIDNPKSLYVSDLYGYRLKYFNPLQVNNRLRVLLELKNPILGFNETSEFFYESTVFLQGELVELNIVDWAVKINHLFSASNSIDSEVMFSLTSSAKELFKVPIKHYQIALVPIKDEATVELDSDLDLNLEELQSLDFEARSLSEPERKPITLEQKYSAGIPLPAWNVVNQINNSGCWIISVSPGCPYKVRPLLWDSVTVESTHELSNISATSLMDAVNISQLVERANAIYSQFSEMAKDSSNRGWQYLDAFWNGFGQLPLSSFDLWRILSTHYPVLCGLCANGKYITLINRLNEEMEVCWELIPMRLWHGAFSNVQERLLSELEDAELVRSVMENKIKRITEVSSSLEVVKMILQHQFIKPDASIMQAPKAVFSSYLHDEQEKLVQRNANHDYPSKLDSFISKYAKEYLAESPEYIELIRVNNPHHNSVLYLPMILAHNYVYAYLMGTKLSRTELFQINRLREFDEEWFDESFKWFSLFLFQNLIIKD